MAHRAAAGGGRDAAAAEGELTSAVATALVTGSERGLGLALCRELAARGDEVIAACLRRSSTLDALGVETVDGVDVTSADAIERLASSVGGRHLDLIVSNAGVNERAGGFADPDPSAMAREYDVNVLGAVRLVAALLPKLRRGSNVALITTGRGASVHQPMPARGANYGYRMSKGALNVFGALLAMDLHERGISVAMISPGPMDTELLRSTSPMPAPDAAEVAPDVLARIDGLTLERSGRWIDRFGDEIG